MHDERIALAIATLALTWWIGGPVAALFAALALVVVETVPRPESYGFVAIGAVCALCASAWRVG